MHDIGTALNAVRARVGELERRYHREPGSVTLLAVSKTKPPEAVRAAVAAGQHAFGENHLQDAMTKVDALDGQGVSWHFIGAVQSNKTRPIAAHFDWVHSIEREKIATRLSAQRPAGREPLDVCIEVNVSGEDTKSGVSPAGVEPLARLVRELPGLRLRGLMAIPCPAEDFETQRIPFRLLREILDDLNAKGLGLDTLSMGMTADLEAAIAEGATIVRIGTAIFGPR
ncbi:MAG: YggS family pyridoxal phosphate-dependent enzyme [Gammaproteobacteria bacterium]|nr:YggS family pyridoxal phosphate-dependent enzyme [Gammaproteobacteria bacterium]